MSYLLEDFDENEFRAYTLEWLKVDSSDQAAAAELLPTSVLWELYQDYEPSGEDWDRMKGMHSALQSHTADEMPLLMNLMQAIDACPYDESYNKRVSDNYKWMRFCDHELLSSYPIPDILFHGLNFLTVTEYRNFYSRVVDTILFPTSDEAHRQARKLVDDFLILFEKSRAGALAWKKI